MNVMLDFRACHSLCKHFIWDKEATFWATEEKEEIDVCWSTVWATSPERATGGASRETLSYSYSQTTGSLCVFVYRKKKLVCSFSLLGTIMSKWARSGRSLMLRPVDALQVDAFLTHLPQRTDRQKERQRGRLEKTRLPFKILYQFYECKVKSASAR